MEKVIFYSGSLPVIFALAVLLTGCPGATDGDGDGEAGGDFQLVSGSGTVSVNLLNADTAGAAGGFNYGTISTGWPIGGSVGTITDNMLMTLNDGGNVVFTGGMELVVGGFIDVGDNGGNMAHEGDYQAGKTITVSGNETVVLSYPGDFSTVLGSGKVSVQILGAGVFNTKTFYFGTISMGFPMGGELVIDGSGDQTGTLELGVDFPGGAVLVVGGFIDVNGTGATFHMADNEDYLASKTITVSGDMTVTLNYPADFSLVTGSGKVYVNLVNADSSHLGKTFYYGTVSTGTPLGRQVTISSNSMLLPIKDDSSNDVIFTGGSEIGVGGFIDVNGNGDTFHMADDGDYVAGKTVTVNGDTIVTLTYE